MKLPADLVPDIASNLTLYRYYAAIRKHLEIQSDSKHIRHVAAQAMHQAPGPWRILPTSSDRGSEYTSRGYRPLLSR
jgi:transposase InsO family protein